MEKEKLIDIRLFSFDCAMKLIPVHITDDGQLYNCPDFNIYEAADEIVDYILTGKHPDDELDELLNGGKN